MYKIRVIWVGKTQESHVDSGIEHYLKKLRPYVSVDCITVKAFRFTKGNEAQGKRKETEAILKHLAPHETHIFLDERGKQKSSEALAQQLDDLKLSQSSHVNFIIGGAYGVDHSCLPSNIQLLSLSKMVFPHQLIRVMLLEQLYRAFSIIEGSPYHHG